MTEDDYLIATTRTKVKIALSALRDCQLPARWENTEKDIQDVVRALMSVDEKIYRFMPSLEQDA